MNGPDDPNELGEARLARRDTLRWLAASAAWSGIPAAALAAPAGADGYGTDPILRHDTKGPWRRLLDRRQRRALARLADLMLPPGAGEPAPSTLGIADFIDEWVSAPYPKQQSDRTAIVDGLQAMEALARKQFGRALEVLEAGELAALLDAMAAQESPDFFLRLRYLVVGGYYSTDAGFKAIGYQGNVPLQSFPAVSPEVEALLDAELRRLGL